jgi:hypothetical protein
VLYIYIDVCVCESDDFALYIVTTVRYI